MFWNELVKKKTEAFSGYNVNPTLFGTPILQASVKFLEPLSSYRIS